MDSQHKSEIKTPLRVTSHHYVHSIGTLLNFLRLVCTALEILCRCRDDACPRRHSRRHVRRVIPASMSDGTLSERERLVYSAKLAEQAERYDGTTLLLRGFF